MVDGLMGLPDELGPTTQVPFDCECATCEIRLAINAAIAVADTKNWIVCIAMLMFIKCYIDTIRVP